MSSMSSEYSKEIVEHFKKLLDFNNGADFYPVELHCHTPGSVDDYYVRNIKYSQVSIEYLESELKNLHLIPEGISLESSLSEEMKENILAEIMVANAYKNNIKLLIITDHDNVSWYSKIKNVVERTWRKLKKDYELVVMPGVEITAHSGFHVIAIVEPQYYESLEKYLSVLSYKRHIKKPATIDEIITEVVDNLKGMIYFPHVDQNDSIKKPDVKRTIFANEKVVAVAANNEKMELKFRNLITTEEYKRENSLAFVQDSDAHSPESIGTKPVWLKMTKPSYQGLFHALSDPDVRVSKTPPEKTSHPFISGMAFLDSPVGLDRAQWYYLRFNSALNCLIGARGTGKSTIINWIINAFEQEIDDGKQREWYASFGRILIFLKSSEKNYVIDINPRMPVVKPIGGERPTDISSWIEVSEVSIDGRVSRVKNKTILLDKFKSKNFKQTVVERLALDSRLLHNSFVGFLQLDKSRWDIYKNEYLDRKSAVIDLLSKTGHDIDYINYDCFIENLERSYSDYLEITNKAKTIEKEFAKLLNTTVLKNKLEIVIDDEDENIYQQENLEDIGHLIGDNLPNLKKEIEDHIIGTTYQIFSKAGIQRGIIDLFKLSVTELENKYSIEPFMLSQRQIDSGYKSYEVAEIVSIIKKSLMQKHNNKQIARLLRSVPQPSIKMRLNIRYGQELEKLNPVFKDLDKLSPGQRCVAILILIIETSEFLGDDRPLIIDQPEDHLDNRYIYDYLVKDIRRVKRKRQIIVSTHNPNIPVCADAEQLLFLLMKSDGNKMWVDFRGSLDYQENCNNGKIKAMISCIQETLEGGKLAFRHRMKKYGFK